MSWPVLPAVGGWRVAAFAAVACVVTTAARVAVAAILARRRRCRQSATEFRGSRQSPGDMDRAGGDDGDSQRPVGAVFPTQPPLPLSTSAPPQPPASSSPTQEFAEILPSLRDRGLPPLVELPLPTAVGDRVAPAANSSATVASSSSSSSSAPLTSTLAPLSPSSLESTGENKASSAVPPSASVTATPDDTDPSLRDDLDIRSAFGKLAGPGGVMGALVPLELLRRRRDTGCGDSPSIVLCAVPGCSARVVVRVLAFHDPQLASARTRLSVQQDARSGAVEAALATLPQKYRRHLPEFYGTYTVQADPFLLGTLTDREEADFRRAHATAADRLPAFRVYSTRTAVLLSCTVMEYVPHSLATAIERFPAHSEARRIAVDTVVVEVARVLADLQRVCDFRHNDLHQHNVRLRSRVEYDGDGAAFVRPGSVTLIDPDYMCARVPASLSSRSSSVPPLGSSSSSSSTPSPLLPTPPSSLYYPPPPSLRAHQVCGPCIASAESAGPDGAFRRRVFDEACITPPSAPLRAWYDLATFVVSARTLASSRCALWANVFLDAHGVEWLAFRPRCVARPFSPADYARFAANPVAYLERMRVAAAN